MTDLWVLEYNNDVAKVFVAYDNGTAVDPKHALKFYNVDQALDYRKQNPQLFMYEPSKHTFDLEGDDSPWLKKR